MNIRSYWPWRGKSHETPNPSLSSSDFPMGLRELDSLRFAAVNGTRIRSNARRVKRTWRSREERRIDKEYVVVLVPSDGGCTWGSESESDDSDWSIGWLEAHAPEFQSENETEDNFAVLVPCYGRGSSKQVVMSSRKLVLGAVDLMEGNHSDGEKYIEQWLAEHLSA